MNEQILDEQISQNVPPSSPPIEVHVIVQTMANIMNYLSVSLYEGQFTKNYEDSYATLHSIYDSAASTPSVAPSLNDCTLFYDNIVYLANVTYTDDPDYYTFRRILRKYIVELTIITQNK
jgi:hypothetical protein